MGQLEILARAWIRVPHKRRQNCLSGVGTEWLVAEIRNQESTKSLKKEKSSLTVFMDENQQNSTVLFIHLC